MTSILRLEGLTKAFGPLTAVDDLNLEVRQGEILGFLGPNGAGKTTTLSMISGLIKPDRGHVYLHGQRVASGAAAVRSRMGISPQQVVVWPILTCLEQLIFIGEMYGLKTQQARERALSLLENLGLGERAGQLARTLSGGMKRRLSLALALVHNPELLILDEPESGLDPQSRVLVREFIRSLSPQKTVLLTTHNMDEADRMADRVAIIDQGRLLAVDQPERLKRQFNCETLEDLFLALTGRRLRE